MDYTTTPSSSEGVWVIRNELHEEQARFDRWLEARQELLAEIGRRYSAMRRILWVTLIPLRSGSILYKWKTHGQTDA
jgi:hypothetical protein